MPNKTAVGGGSAPKWALIHRVPVFGTRASGIPGQIKWRPYTQWVKVGSPKWNRIMAAAAKSNVKITPTRYARSKNGKPPAAPDSQPGTTVSDRNPVRNPVNNDPINGINPGKQGGKGGKVPGQNPSGGAGGRGRGGKGGGGSGGGGGGGGGNGSTALRYIGKPNVGKMIPKSEAAKIAQLQFGGQIADTKNQINTQTAQGAQDLHDIAHWYQAVQNQAGQAAQVSQQAAQQGAGADAANTQALLHAIGGGANPGAGQVAAAGDSASALQRALGTIAAQGGATQQAAYQNASAGASAAQQALNDQAMSALQSQLTSLQGQRGDAQAQALMQIIQANNATLQQRFQNRLASIGAAESAAMLPGQLKLQQAQVGQAQAARTAAVNQNKQAASGHIGWNTLDAGTQQKLAQSWMINPDGQTLATKNVALARARAQGYTAPAVVNYINTLYR